MINLPALMVVILSLPPIPQASDVIEQVQRDLNPPQVEALKSPEPVPAPEPTYSPPPKPEPSPEPATVAVPPVLKAIARCEGYPRFVNRRHPGPSSASGKYGFLRGTWDGYGGYAAAWRAPEHVQDAAAVELYRAAGTTPWNASKHCWG